jgi:CTP synthase (UTP-ammonia lyase)
MKPATVALVGDYSTAVFAHRCIPRALELAAAAAGATIAWSWVHTGEIRDAALTLANFSAVWAVPASPYASMDGALAAIRCARKTGRPFLGTCGGFQHALIEFARNVCGQAADHAETNPAAGEALVVTPLACSWVGKTGGIRLAPGSRLREIYGSDEAREAYHCSYGLAPQWRERLESAGLRFTAFDENGEPRGFELPAHPFFTGTLFQPERSAARDEPHPLITAFVRSITLRSKAC